MNVTINIVELACELASHELEETYGDKIVILQNDEDEEGGTKYTDEAQDIFNDLYDKYYTFIDNCKISSE
jgi:hypothetical protein